MTNLEMVLLKYPNLKGIKSPLTADAYETVREEVSRILTSYNINLCDVQYRKKESKQRKELRQKVLKKVHYAVLNKVSFYAYPELLATLYNISENSYRGYLNNN